MKCTVEMNCTNTYILGNGMCSVSITKDEITGNGTKWGVVISRLNTPLPIGDHIKNTKKIKAFDPTIILSDGKEGIRVLLRAAMKAYAEMGGNDIQEVWEDSKRFFAEAAKTEK